MIKRIILFCSVLISCSQITEDMNNPIKNGTYILNNGNWGSNDSSIGVYDPGARTYSPDMFFRSNRQKLGDLGQDMIEYENKVYITVNGSRTIFVTDTELKIQDQITVDHNGSRLSPKTLAKAGDKLYVTYYEGYVGEITPKDNSVRLCRTGPNPDGITVAGNYLYIANSGGMEYPGYNNTLSVISLSSFKEENTIEVNINPYKLEASSDGSFIYIYSFGNYADIPPKLQVLEIASGKVSDLSYSSVSSIAKGNDDILYILCGGYDQEWNPLPGTVLKHDMSSNRKAGEFVSDDTVLKNAYSISVASDGYIYIGCSDYKTTGDVYVFTQEGFLHDSFDSCGLNPIKAL